MTDIVERLRKLGGDGSTGYGMPIASEAADRIAELEHELAGHRKSLSAAKQIIAGQENSIMRMAEHNLKCVEAVTSLQSEREANARLTDELAAAQAREKVLHSLSNELLHQIDINDFTDSHGHSAKMLKAVHDLMKYNTQPTDDTALNNLLAEGQANNKMLRDALFELANLHVVVHSQSPEGRAYMKKLGDLMASSDDTALHNLIVYERLDAVRNCQTIYEKLMLTDLLKAERELCCTEIKAADDKSSEDDYMLDSNDCISVIRGTWKGGE